MVHELLTPSGDKFQLRGTPKKGETFGAGFNVLFSRGIEAMMNNKELTAYDYRLMWWLVAGPADTRLNFDTWKVVNAGDVIAALDGSTSGVSRSMVRLQDLGIIERESRGGGPRAARWRLHEHFMWKGTTGAYWRKVAERRTAARKVSELPPPEAE